MDELGHGQRWGRTWRRWPFALAGAALVVGAAAPALAAPLNTVCPPPPEGVFGLPGAPQFAAPTPDTFGAQLDDPRWNGNYRQDFTDASSTETDVRMLRDGDALYVSFEARVDPDGEAPTVDGVYVGFSQNGTTAVMTRLTMSAAAPLTNSNAIGGANWWKTTNGGTTPWRKQALPQTWATGTNVHAWAGTGTGTGSAWALNAKFSLTDIGAALGGAALTGPFSIWFEIAVQTTSAGTIPYDWPSSAPLGFDATSTGCSGGSPCAVLPVNTFGTAYPTLTTDCPTGIKIDPMSIGVLPLSGGGIPGTMVHFGLGHAANQFVAVMTDTSGATIAANTVEGRFRIANWGSTVGVGGDWKDMVTDGSNHAVLGLNTATGSQVELDCVNSTSGPQPECFQPPTPSPPYPADQCLLVELAQHGGSGATFVSSSARRNMDFVNASTFERTAEISIRGLAPLAGSPGTRDAYIYVRTLNLPAETNGNPPIVVPDPVPPVKQRERALPPAADGQPPRYRLTTYDRYASVMPTYEVHVYHDTGRTRFEDGVTRKILEPQAPFGYFVQHAGDLSGWRHALTGEGFVLEELAPNFYHAKIPDNGSVKVHTKIDSCRRVLFGLINRCGTGRGGCQCVVGSTDVTGDLGALSLVVFALACRLRRRRPGA